MLGCVITTIDKASRFSGQNFLKNFFADQNFHCFPVKKFAKFAAESESKKVGESLFIQRV